MVLIGQDISEQLDILPMQVRVIRNIRNRYGCPGSQHAPVTAPLPAQPLSAYFSPSWTVFQAERGRYFSVNVDGISN